MEQTSIKNHPETGNILTGTESKPCFPAMKSHEPYRKPLMSCLHLPKKLPWVGFNPKSQLIPQVYQLEDSETTIGRGEDCSLLLEGRGVSRNHARLLLVLMDRMVWGSGQVRFGGIGMGF